MTQLPDTNKPAHEPSVDRGVSQRELAGVVLAGCVIAAVSLFPSWEVLTTAKDDTDIAGGPRNESASSKIRRKADLAFFDGRWDTASQQYRRLLQLNENQGGIVWFRLGYALHAEGEHEEAMSAHRKAAQFSGYGPVAKYNLACALALTGEHDAAIKELESAIKAGFVSRDRPINQDDDFESMLDDPRFQQLVDRARPGAAPNPDASQDDCRNSTTLGPSMTEADPRRREEV